MGPVISAETAKEVVKRQKELLAQGGKALLEATHIKPKTGFVSPGIVDLTEVDDLEDRETFGPLLQVIHVANLDQAIVEANHTQFGLSAGLLSDDHEAYEVFRQHVKAGIINWNQQITGASSAAPFGGVGISGNHRPSAYFAADYCAYPVASIEVEKLSMPTTIPPGMPRGISQASIEV